MNHVVYPTINDTIEKLTHFFDSRHASSLSITDIVHEAQHWESQLDDLHESFDEETKEKPGAKGARWGGAVVTVASFPAAFRCSYCWPVCCGSWRTSIWLWRISSSRGYKGRQKTERKDRSPGFTLSSSPRASGKPWLPRPVVTKN
jgi:hypothetical protein